jgi:hypothetical protein
MTRLKTRRSWIIAVPAFVLLLGVVVLGQQMYSSSTPSNVPVVPEGTARTVVPPADPVTVTVRMDEWWHPVTTSSSKGKLP